MVAILRRVLIVDDEPNVRRTLAIGFRLHGFEVEEAPGSESAMRALQTSGFDAAIVDLMLPEVNGLELARWIRTFFPAMRVILMSGYHLSERQIERADAGIVGFLPKPFHVDEAVRVCAECLGDAPQRAVG
jgi:DNA-binding response OmpR family regulator